MIDRDKVINGLEKLRKDLGYGLPDRSNVVVEYLNSLTDAIDLLKIQELDIEALKNTIQGMVEGQAIIAGDRRVDVVRCKGCKHWSAERINDYNKCKRWINVGVKNFATMGDWFCADGERKDTE